MKRNRLGLLDIRVSELCFGMLPMGPLQANLPQAKAIRLLRQAYDGDIIFFDTAELYQTYEFLQAAFTPSDGVIIASKSTAVTYPDMEKSVEFALRKTGREVIDIFHLHAARATKEVFSERSGALTYLVKAREKGLIRAIGISTHAVDVVEAAALQPEIEVVFPIVNLEGIGILHGNLSGMLQAIKKVYQNGKGLYAMKVLAGGHLLGSLIDALDYVRNIREFSSLAIGMVREVELAFHLAYFGNQPIPRNVLELCQDRRQKKLIMLPFCRHCERCLETCPAGAIARGSNGLIISPEKCLSCGYCLPACPEFNLRFV
ncbi:MAG TPA: aldo/keto reductase [Atribacteraceae bacterium]|nr:aldo/keto reductase [Atribacteraceae bacterium]